MADLVAARIRAAAALPPQSRKRGADGDHRGLRGDEKLRCTPGTEGKAYDAIDVTNLDDRGRKTPTTVTKSDAFVLPRVAQVRTLPAGAGTTTVVWSDESDEEEDDDFGALLYCDELDGAAAASVKTPEDRGRELVAAVEAGDIDQARRLMVHDDQVDPNVRVDGETALITAVHRGHIDMVELLLTHPRLDPNIKGDEGAAAALHWAMENYLDGEPSEHSGRPYPVQIILALVADPRTDLSLRDGRGDRVFRHPVLHRFVQDHRAVFVSGNGNKFLKHVLGAMQDRLSVPDIRFPAVRLETKERIWKAWHV